MTNQEAYDAILVHFTQPDAVLAWGDITTVDEYDRKMTEPGCVYRAGGDPESPIRCAFGCLIPDSMYHPNMENTTASGVLSTPGKYDDLMKYMEGVDRVFLDTIQTLHDSIAGREGTMGTVDDFLSQLREWPNKPFDHGDPAEGITNSMQYEVEAPS